MEKHSLLKLGKDKFPITVDFTFPVIQMYQRVLSQVSWSGRVDLRKYIPPIELGVKDFMCSLATLTEDSELRHVQAYAKAEGIILTDVLQFLAFCFEHIQTEVTEEKYTPIAAAAVGSTWLCSHKCLGEMMGVEWTNFYRAPGPVLHTISDSLKKGTRFLTICPLPC